MTPQLKYSRRIAENSIFASFQTPFITAILGPRRVGKSTLINRFMEQHPGHKWVMFNMDNLALRQRAAKNQLAEMIEEAALQKIGDAPKIWVVIDEAQKCPASFDQIKILYDTYKDTNTIKFILSGSALLQLHQLSAETLAGRIYLHYLREFSLQEGLELTLDDGVSLPSSALFDTLQQHFVENSHHAMEQLQTQIASVIKQRQSLRALLLSSLQQQLCWGGFPEVLMLPDADNRLRYLGSYLQTYLEKDIRAIENIADINLYQHLMQVVAGQTGSLRDDEKILSVLACSRNTLKKYRDYLAATLLLKDIYPYIDSPLRRLVKSPKSYFLNNGLISYLSGIADMEILKSTGLISHRLENWFLKELQIWLDREARFNQIYYWRTSGGSEVDFIVEKTPHIFPFEVTYATKIEARKVNNLKRFLQHVPAAKYGFYIYMGDFYCDLEARICFLPAWAVS